MRCPTFLLAFCAFETVFAAVPSTVITIDQLHLYYNIQMKSIVASFKIKFKKSIEKALQRPLPVEPCINEFDEVERCYKAKDIEIHACYLNAKRHGILQVADVCYVTSFAQLQSRIAFQRVAVKQCLDDIFEGRTYTPEESAGPSSSNQPHTG